ncbi:hypothetical protein FH972_017832 [Carpinus fangiana]|uniref:Uncharacterized protein n=1 Tax=Carpinus fangiana TaxID=176857 RepID=A0A5N6RKL8_9ROSI|nr:hypothetical protein FH972_017832 [Carpinus fangiana]
MEMHQWHLMRIFLDMGGNKEGGNGLNLNGLGSGGSNGLFRSPSTQPKATYTGPVMANVEKTMLASMGLKKERREIASGICGREISEDGNIAELGH